MNSSYRLNTLGLLCLWQCLGFQMAVVYKNYKIVMFADFLWPFAGGLRLSIFPKLLLLYVQCSVPNVPPSSLAPHHDQKLCRYSRNVTFDSWDSSQNKPTRQIAATLAQRHTPINRRTCSRIVQKYCHVLVLHFMRTKWWHKVFIGNSYNFIAQPQLDDKSAINPMCLLLCCLEQN